MTKWCERWCVKDGVSKMVCKRWCVTKGRCMSPSGTPDTQNEGGCHMMSPSTTPATQKSRGVTGVTAAICPTPATQNDGGCEFVPRLPRETKVNVTKCHACHAKWRGAPGDKIRTKRATQYHECHACHAKTTVDLSLCHACHVKRR